MLNNPMMTQPMGITIRNNLIKEKREISVYHHSQRASHIISYNQSLNNDLKLVDGDDFLQISAVSGPGNLQNDCILDLPSFMDFIFRTAREVTFVHSGQRTLLKIPPGPPTWEIRMTLPRGFSSLDPIPRERITIGDIGNYPDWTGERHQNRGGKEKKNIGGYENDRHKLFRRMYRGFGRWLQSIFQFRGQRRAQGQHPGKFAATAA